MSSLYGLKIATSEYLTVTREDWSDVRSPGRARRRRKLGHPQRIVYRQVPDPSFYKMDNTLIMHPEMYKRLMQEIEKVQIDTILYGAGAMMSDWPGKVPHHVDLFDFKLGPLRMDPNLFYPFRA